MPATNRPNAEVVSNDPTGLTRIFRALRYRNYRLFFIGQGISLIGTWMQQVAISWLVYSLTNSAWLLGVVAFSGLICTFLLTPFAGVLVDRLDRHRILVVTQILAMLQALTLAAVVLTGSAAVWNLILLSMALGLINAFDMPTRQSFVLDMVTNRADLSNAIALNSSLFNSARLIGPSIAGVMVATVGEGLCFLINGISFIAVIACLLAMRMAPTPPRAGKENFFRGMKDGANYAFGFPPVKYIIVLLAFSALVAMPYPVLMPVFAGEVLKGGANTLGFLMASAGVGALAGAIYLAMRKNAFGLDKVIVVSTLSFGAGLICFSLSRIVVLSMLFMAITGFGMVVQLAACNTILQTIADDDKRGRVMSLYVMSFMGLAPFGSLLFGGLADIIGAPYTLLIGGVCILTGGVIFARKFSSIKGMVHRAYVKRGLMPD
ncbi:MAG: MFS transporter [Dehalococcoidia bacterium]|nr:MFS transporter [Dehalococcoidia bacterium]